MKQYEVKNFVLELFKEVFKNNEEFNESQLKELLLKKDEMINLKCSEVSQRAESRTFENFESYPQEMKDNIVVRMDAKTIGNFSSTSKSFLEHCKKTADYFSERLNLNSQSLVLEIASNDGAQLQYFKQLGILQKNRNRLTESRKQPGSRSG